MGKTVKDFNWGSPVFLVSLWALFTSTGNTVLKWFEHFLDGMYPLTTFEQLLLVLKSNPKILLEDCLLSKWLLTQFDLQMDWYNTEKSLRRLINNPTALATSKINYAEFSFASQILVTVDCMQEREEKTSDQALLIISSQAVTVYFSPGLKTPDFHSKLMFN